MGRAGPIARRMRIAVERTRAAIDRRLHPGATAKLQIVVCGFPRSGTSLLYNMLAVALPGFRNEPFELPAIDRIWRHGDWITKRPLDLFALEKLVAHNRHRKRIVALVPIRDFRDLVTSIHPNVPNDYFIGWEHSYRVGLSEGAAPALVAPGVRDFAQQIERARAIVGIELVFVRYEQLVREPDAVGAELERRLGVKFERSFGSFHRYADEHPYRYDAEHTTSDVDRDRVREHSAVDAEQVGRWRAPEHRGRIHREFTEHPELCTLLRDYGYEPDDAWLGRLDDAERELPRAAQRPRPRARPRVFLLANRPGWAFDHVARALTLRLSDRFALRVIYQGVETRDLDPAQVDLLYVFWWGDQTYRHLGIPPERIVKEVASHRWALEEKFGRIDAGTFAARYLDDCATVTTPSLRLFEILAGHHANVFHCPNGVDLARFHGTPRRWRGLRIAWSGNPHDPCKGLHDVLVPACAGRFALERTDGARSHAEVAELYARSDVIAVASEAESQPLPLLEAMASGCFPVTTDVGIARELIVSGVNGLIVDRTPEAFRRAFQWCDTHQRDVRRAGRLNARLLAEERDWDRVALRHAEIFDKALGRGAAPARIWQPAPGPSRDAIARGRVPARFAFVTPEYATEDTLGGGLGAYLRSAARALAASGHEVEVFTTGRAAAREADGAAVIHRVPGAISRRWVRALLRICRLLRIRRATLPLLAVVDALALARALAARERTGEFDAVQSSDFRATGLFVAGHLRRGRPHLVRASNDQAELAARNGDNAGSRAWLDALQRRCLRRADVAYAPSRFLARHYAERYGIHLRVGRPPAPPAGALTPPPDGALPKRYFVHFGQLSPVKGSADLAAALPRVWERAPDFEMVWAGVDRGQRLPGWRALWGARHRQVHWLGELPRAELHAIVARADAAVLPSRFDNLPNTVIESLSLGVPVIGTIGASIEELVTPGRDGDLVPIADPEALAAAIVARWRAGPPRERSAGLPASLDPQAAVDALLALAGLRDGPVERWANEGVCPPYALELPGFRGRLTALEGKTFLLSL